MEALSLYLKRMFPGKSQVYYDRLDFVVVVFAGSIIGTICFSPRNALQALAAGFGWVGAMNVMLKTQMQPVQQEDPGDRRKADNGV